ncbi:ABC transporter [Paraoerskovia sediminicola]|uniref:ABC transporter n=1 Tax=Paraoerskovia sediminicola TaxID=1138587 RepID=A0ABM8FYR6_9CELL|nr:dynamin family protein [Paraoerskovia sediminicola]BDZ40754.1 ABC transporter [Paraoerskovia sediminicola]
MTTPPAPDAGSGGADLTGAVEALRAEVASVALPLVVPGVDAAVAVRDALVDQLEDYLLPRLRSADAPLLVVVGGSTGAGKSTLVNSLLGVKVSASGVLRPTTRAPVLVHRVADEPWFLDARVLPDLVRLRTATGAVGAADAADATGAAAPASTPPVPSADAPDVGTPTEAGRPSLRLVADDALPAGLALLDAPDVDSVADENRALAAQLFAAADLWLFVTTPARYADAVPWDLLAAAARRHAEVTVVLDRVGPDEGEVVDDLVRLMGEHGLVADRLVQVPESGLEDGLLPPAAVAPVSRRLARLGADPAARRHVAEATRDGAVDDVVRRARGLASASQEQIDAAERLRSVVVEQHAEAREHVRAVTSDGTMLRGEVLARWQDFVGTGEFFRALEDKVGRLRDRIAAFLRGRPRAPRVEEAIAHGLEAVLLDAVEGAAERTASAWRGDTAGRELLLTGLVDLPLDGGVGGQGGPVGDSGLELRERVARDVRGWQSDVLDLVREQGAGRRGVARALSFGLNGVGVSLMVVVFASTGGLTGAEVGIAGGTALAAQKVLEAVFGDDAVRRLTRQAHERLDARTDAVLTEQAARWTDRLDAVLVPAPDPEALLAAADAVAAAALATKNARKPDAVHTSSDAPSALSDPGRLRGAQESGPADVPSAGDGTGSTADRTAGSAASTEDSGADAPARRRGFWRRRGEGQGR